jgi:hypothetical protein
VFQWLVFCSHWFDIPVDLEFALFIAEIQQGPDGAGPVPDKEVECKLLDQTLSDW